MIIESRNQKASATEANMNDPYILDNIDLDDDDDDEATEGNESYEQSPEENEDNEENIRGICNEESDDIYGNNASASSRIRKAPDDGGQHPPEPKKRKVMEYEVIEDSILMCVGEFKPPLDPLVKCPIKTPVKNRLCGHVYEKDTILGYINRPGKKVKCPYIGCVSGYLKKENLVEDKELKRKIEEYFENHEESSDDDSEDEECICLE